PKTPKPLLDKDVINKKMIETLQLISNSFWTACAGLLGIYIFVCISRSMFKYRVYGLSLYLLIGLEIAVLAMMLYFIFYIRCLQLYYGEQASSAKTKKFTAFYFAYFVFMGIDYCFS
ncbi:MAG: hypothetical protein ACKO96_46375, partial [Flammeovirgaceae bacterium]